MTSTLAQTPLHDWHASHGGRMVDFAGWSMPVVYSSIVAEHQATRTAVGLFDVSHMGRLRFAGPNSERFLDSIATRRITGMPAGQIRYSLVTADSGGILDDVLVYHVPQSGSGSAFQMVVNASNRHKIVDWLDAHGDGETDVHDITADTAMIAVQGPRALDVVRPLVSLDPSALNYYHGAAADICGAAGMVSRTGYTGEDGCELIVPAGVALELWESLHAAAAKIGGSAAGLGARDTLRLEAGMPLYGHELDEHTNPFQAGLSFAVHLEDRQFPGRDALVHLKDDQSLHVRAGWVLSGKRPAREGYTVFSGDRQIGRVTSGTFSPTLERPIAMGYVPVEFAAPGCEVAIDIRGSRAPALAASLPFYRRVS